MNKNLENFLNMVADDADLAEKLSACKSEDEAYAVASAVQDGFTKEEFVETMKAIDAANRSEISREDLNMVAGGGEEEEEDDTLCSTITTVTTATAIPITAGAAGAAAI